MRATAPAGHAPHGTIPTGDGTAPPAARTGPARRLLFLALAALFFALGVLGVILPGLPATPFLLLTSYFLVRSWPAANDWLLRSRFFGPILTDWQQRGGVRRGVKIWTLLIVTAAVTLTLWQGGLSLPLSAAVLLLALIGIVVVLRLPLARETTTP